MSDQGNRPKIFQKRSAPFVLPLLFVSLTCAPSYGADQIMGDEALNRLAVGLVGGLGESLKNFQPAKPNCGAEPPPTPKKKAQAEVDQSVVAFYSCDSETSDDVLKGLDLPKERPIVKAPVPSPSLSPRPKGRVTTGMFDAKPGEMSVEASTWNDNLLFGALSGNKFFGKILPQHDDVGGTFGTNVAIAYVLPKDSFLGKAGDEVGIKGGMSLNTAYVRGSYSEAQKIVDGYKQATDAGEPYYMPGSSTPVILRQIYDSSTPEKIMRQQALSTMNVEVYKTFRYKGSYVRAEVGFESRSTGTQSVPLSTQSGFHKMLGADQWTTVDVNGVKGSATMKKVGKGYNETLGIEGDVYDIDTSPEIAANDDMKKVGKWAASAGLTAGQSAYIMGGSCKLDAAVSGKLVMQNQSGKMTIDPNTFLSAEASAKYAVIKNRKWNDSILTAKASGAVFVYPKSFDARSKPLFLTASGGVEATGHVGKQGNRIVTALEFFGPNGKNQIFDDRESRFSLGIKYIFGGKGKPVRR